MLTPEFDLVIRCDRVLVDGEFRPAEVGTRDGKILAIDPWRLHGLTTVTLAPDEVLIPGLVDSHVHIDEPGRTTWEGFETGTRAAAAGGVTTVIDMPLGSIPATTTVHALEAKHTVASEKAMIDVGMWGGAVPENLGTLRELHEAGVFGFKAFLTPSGIEEFGYLDAGQFERVLEEIGGFDGLLIVHAEDPAILAAHAGAGGRRYADFVESRPDEAEIAAIELVIAAARRTGARVHIAHLSSARALPALRAARTEGLPITVETCPHYLTFVASEIPDGATQFKCCPPIRSAENRDALWQGLIDGDIDLIVSDHDPSTVELKFVHDGDFALAQPGIAGLQLGLAAVWTEAARRDIPLARVVEWMSAAPARLVGLAQKGRIAVGADADLVAFAPDEEFRVRASHLQHRNQMTAFEGLELTGVVHRTWLRGHEVDIAVRALPFGRVLGRPLGSDRAPLPAA
ncbi:MAG: allantoinase AllB [Galbitalea sp.]